MLFTAQPGKSFSRERILNLVWGYEFEGFEHTVNSHINGLRSKIEPDIKILELHDSVISVKSKINTGTSFIFHVQAYSQA